MTLLEKRIIGNATLYCGDSLELLRAGVFGKIGAIVSDPPYGINYAKNGGGTGRINSNGILTNGVKGQEFNSIFIVGDDAPFDPQPWIDCLPEAFISDHSKAQGHGAMPILLWGADHYMQRLPDGGTMLAWDKHLGRGADDNFTDCEWAWVGRKVKREVFRWLWKGVCAEKCPLDTLTTVTTARATGKVFARVHVSQKPVELMRWCIDKVRPQSGLPILDPYMGSGTTGIAALSLGHSFVGCEIDPAHFDVACRRIEKFLENTTVEALPLFKEA